MQFLSRTSEESHGAICGSLEDSYKLGSMMLPRKLSLTCSETTTLQRANSECDFEEELEPWWDVSVDDEEVEFGEPEEHFDAEGSEEYVLYPEQDFGIDESTFDEVPFPYIRRNGQVVMQPSVELKLERPTQPAKLTKRELRSSRPLATFEGLALEEKFKWRSQFDEPGQSKFKRTVAFLVSHLQPVPTRSDFSPY